METNVLNIYISALVYSSSSANTSLTHMLDWTSTIGNTYWNHDTALLDDSSVD